MENEPYKMFYKTSLDDSKFYVSDLSLKIGRPKICGNIKLLPLYTIPRSVTKKKDIKILCIFQEHFKNLKTHNDESLN